MPNMQKEKTPMPEQAPDVRKNNWEEVAQGYTAEQAMNEASRCLACKKPLCVEGCPVSVRIPEFLAAAARGEFEEAYAILKGTNSLPAVCGRVCPQETQCEGKCVRGIKGEPVAIGRVERFCADYVMSRTDGAHDIGCEAGREAVRMDGAAGSGGDTASKAGGLGKEGCAGSCPAKTCAEKGCRPETTAEETVEKKGRVAVVGSGPAGLSCAGDLAQRGYQVTVFEALHKAGGVLVYGIPEFRLPKAVVAKEIDELKKRGVSIECDMVIGRILSVDELFERGFEAVFVATGAGLPRFMGIPGENANGVFSANEFLTRINLMKAYREDYGTPIKKGTAVAVVGGGNVAMDAARSAKRLGAEEVYILYRRSETEMPARREEVHHAREEGVTFCFLTNPTKIETDEAGNVKAVTCVKMELGEPDASGRRSPVEVPDSSFSLPVDTVVIAVGTAPNPLIRMTTPGLETDRRGCIVTSDGTTTTRTGVYAGGDAVTGAATVILAMGAGREAATRIDAYIQEKRHKESR